jgi:hypothetical protein
VEHTNLRQQFFQSPASPKLLESQFCNLHSWLLDTRQGGS